MGPTVCMHRSPLGGRNFESFSEDPLLAGLLSAQYIKGVQAEDISACIKHYAVNEQETRRNTVNEIISERALRYVIILLSTATSLVWHRNREIYLRPFEIAIKQANPWSVMTSFPKLNGIHCDMNDYLLKHVLRGEWNWNGMVMSDWEGTNSTVESLKAGLVRVNSPTFSMKRWRSESR